MSYMEIEEDDTANTGSVLCRVMLVYAVWPNQLATGALFDGVL